MTALSRTAPDVLPAVGMTNNITSFRDLIVWQKSMISDY
jgi:hypothetical protein